MSWEKQFAKLHYEPEHQAGGFCWCKPTFKASEGEMHIEHNEQRTVLKNFIRSLL